MTYSEIVKMPCMLIKLYSSSCHKTVDSLRLTFEQQLFFQKLPDVPDMNSKNKSVNIKSKLTNQNEKKGCVDIAL